MTYLDRGEQVCLPVLGSADLFKKLVVLRKFLVQDILEHLGLDLGQFFKARGSSQYSWVDVVGVGQALSPSHKVLEFSMKTIQSLEGDPKSA
jgi:hypothetical protein